MSLADEVAAETRAARHPAHTCPVQKVAHELSPDERAELVELLAGDCSGERLAAVLSRKTGVHVRGRAIGVHRRQECSCARWGLEL